MMPFITTNTKNNIAWWMVAAVIAMAQPAPESAQDNHYSKSVPENLCSPYGAYPNPLGITDEDRASFHPVIKFPMIWSDTTSTDGGGGRAKIPDVAVADHTRPSERPQMATDEERKQRREQIQSVSKWLRRLLSRVQALPLLNKLLSGQTQSVTDEVSYGIGRYDENRIGMYNSEIFQDTEHSIGGYAGARTVHVGIDLSGPLGTPVFAFAEGVVHSVGYNAELGDYGNVIVLEHTVPSNGRKMWVLYGHLDGTSTRGTFSGQRIRKGQRIGRLGDIHENGGW